MLQCPGGPPRTLHVSGCFPFHVPGLGAQAGRVGSTLQEQWGQGGDGCALPLILHPRGCTELCEPCGKSQSRDGQTDLGSWLWF